LTLLPLLFWNSGGLIIFMLLWKNLLLTHPTALLLGFFILRDDPTALHLVQDHDRLSLCGQKAYELNDLTDITSGSNGAYQATIGYDLCTGLGVPNSGFTTAWLKANGVDYTPPPAAPSRA
jgi:hypothetical protein